MRGIWRVSTFLWASCFIVLSGILVSSDVSVISEAAALEDLSEDVSFDPKRVIKREALQEGEEEKCSVVRVDKDDGLVPVKEVNQMHYTFFLKPDPKFQEVKFNLLIDNLWNLAGPYKSFESIVFDNRDLEAEAEGDRWVEFRVDYFKHEVKNGRDKHGLKVTVGNTSRQVINSRWWRTHDFKGSLVSSKGPATFLFDCPPQNPVVPIPARLLNTPALLGGMLAVAFLLVVVPWACVMQRRRSSRITDEAPKVPPLPKSLQLLEKDKVSKKPDQENVYEEFDEDTLARLRQKLSAQTLSGEAEDSSSYHHYEKLKPRPLQRQETVEKQTRAPENYYENTATMSLREEKEKARKAERQRSLSESQYVEMHGILNRRSFDFTK